MSSFLRRFFIMFIQIRDSIFGTFKKCHLPHSLWAMQSRKPLARRQGWGLHVLCRLSLWAVGVAGGLLTAGWPCGHSPGPARAAQLEAKLSTCFCDISQWQCCLSNSPCDYYTHSLFIEHLSGVGSWAETESNRNGSPQNSQVTGLFLNLVKSERSVYFIPGFPISLCTPVCEWTQAQAFLAIKS